MIWDSETREQLVSEREETAFNDDNLMHRLVSALNYAQTSQQRNPHAAKKDEAVRGHRVARTQVIPRDSETANSAPEVKHDSLESIMNAREKAHKLYMASYGFTDAVLGSTSGRSGQNTHAARLFEARIGALRSRLETALTTVLQQLFTEYATSDTRLRLKRPKELGEEALGHVFSAHQAGLLPNAEARALVHHQLGGVCHPRGGGESEEQPAEVEAAAEDACSVRSDSLNSRA